eukprot:jgi/Ulvmu1/5988/UM026_0112.1
MSDDDDDLGLFVPQAASKQRATAGRRQAVSSTATQPTPPVTGVRALHLDSDFADAQLPSSSDVKPTIPVEAAQTTVPPLPPSTDAWTTQAVSNANSQPRQDSLNSSHADVSYEMLSHQNTGERIVNTSAAVAGDDPL